MSFFSSATPLVQRAGIHIESLDAGTIAVLVREQHGRGYQLFATSSDVIPLDGRSVVSPAAAQDAVIELARAGGRVVRLRLRQYQETAA